jgi:hypothetical protein
LVWVERPETAHATPSPTVGLEVEQVGFHYMGYRIVLDILLPAGLPAALALMVEMSRTGQRVIA